MELIIALVIIGILAAVAVPFLTAQREVTVADNAEKMVLAVRDDARQYFRATGSFPADTAALVAAGLAPAAWTGDGPGPLYVAVSGDDSCGYVELKSASAEVRWMEVLERVARRVPAGTYDDTNLLVSSIVYPTSEDIAARAFGWRVDELEDSIANVSPHRYYVFWTDGGYYPVGAGYGQENSADWGTITYHALGGGPQLMDEVYWADGTNSTLDRAVMTDMRDQLNAWGEAIGATTPVYGVRVAFAGGDGGIVRRGTSAVYQDTVAAGTYDAMVPVNDPTGGLSLTADGTMTCLGYWAP